MDIDFQGICYELFFDAKFTIKLQLQRKFVVICIKSVVTP